MTEELPICGFRGGVGRQIVFCRHPATPKTVERSDCLACDLIDSDAAIVRPARRPVRCVHLADLIHREPCTCGASSTVAVHSCNLFGRCAPDKHAKLPTDVRGLIRNCATCQAIEATDGA